MLGLRSSSSLFLLFPDRRAQFGEFLLKAQLARPAATPYFVRWIRRFLSRPASDKPLAVRGFCEDLERNGGAPDWQVRQADQALRIYFVNFVKRTEWHRQPVSTVVDEHGNTNLLAAIEQLRARLRTRHYSYRTECTYVDWVRRLFEYAAKQEGGPQPQVTAEVVRDYLAHLAVHQHVSASTQNQALCAILFLCREVLGVNVEGLAPGARAKRGDHLPVVLSMPETMALLDAMSGTPRLMATLIYGGGLRVTECCELRIDILHSTQRRDRRGQLRRRSELSGHWAAVAGLHSCLNRQTTDAPRRARAPASSATGGPAHA